jgi:hypothetical protein
MSKYIRQRLVNCRLKGLDVRVVEASCDCCRIEVVQFPDASFDRFDVVQLLLRSVSRSFRPGRRCPFGCHVNPTSSGVRHSTATQTTPGAQVRLRFSLRFLQRDARQSYAAGGEPAWSPHPYPRVSMPARRSNLVAPQALTCRLDDPLARRVLWAFLIAHPPRFVLTLWPRSETMPQWISRLSGTSAV